MARNLQKNAKNYIFLSPPQSQSFWDLCQKQESRGRRIHHLKHGTQHLIFLTEPGNDNDAAVADDYVDDYCILQENINTILPLWSPTHLWIQPVLAGENNILESSLADILKGGESETNDETIFGEKMKLGNLKWMYKL